MRASLIAQLIKNPTAMQDTRFNSWVRKTCWRRDILPTPVFLGFSCGSAGNFFKEFFSEENIYWKATVSYLTYTNSLIPHKITSWIRWALQMRSGTFGGVQLWTRILRITGFNNSPLSIQLINAGDVNRNLMSLLFLDDTLK